MSVQLKDHQKLPVEFIKNNFGLILYHSTGSGKTITSLIGMKQFNKDIIIIGPKSSKKAFNDEIKKLKMEEYPHEIYSFKSMKSVLYENLEYLRDKCIIVDEAHHLRNDTKDNIMLRSAITLGYRVMLLTATPVVNYMNDISSLVNTVKKSEVLPTDINLFNFFYFVDDPETGKMEVNNEHMLKEKMYNTLSYYEINSSNSEHYPKKRIKTREIVMNKEQLEQYKTFVKRIIYENELPVDKDWMSIKFHAINKRKLNSFLSATRQLSNVPIPEGKKEVSTSPKIEEIFKIIKAGPLPAVVYSNYLKSGIYPLANKLNVNNITFKAITGGTSNEKLVNIVNSYNKGEFDVLLISSAGSESLDLKNTRQIHIMEPHWNEPKIKQVIGRTARYKSHDSLPENDRNVTVYRWISVFPSYIKNMSADEYLKEVADKKDKIFKEFKGILVEISIEQTYYKRKYEKYKNKYKKLKYE